MENESILDQQIGNEKLLNVLSVDYSLYEKEK